jgi:protein-S-isoprenylcysteine O-methyltransferase Ste14
MKALRSLYTSYLGIQPKVSAGPYKFVRHPGYLGEIMSMFGVGLSLSSFVGLGLAIVSVLLILIRLRPEEEMLMSEFGDEYKNYAKRTKRLIPFIH